MLGSMPQLALGMSIALVGSVFVGNAWAAPESNIEQDDAIPQCRDHAGK